MSAQKKYSIVAAMLAMAVVVSAIVSVYARHESRKQFAMLQELTAERDELDDEWGKLQIEQSSQARHDRVETLARKKIGMRIPSSLEVEVVQQ